MSEVELAETLLGMRRVIDTLRGQLNFIDAMILALGDRQFAAKAALLAARQLEDIVAATRGAIDRLVQVEGQAVPPAAKSTNQVGELGDIPPNPMVC